MMTSSEKYLIFLVFLTIWPSIKTILIEAWTEFSYIITYQNLSSISVGNNETINNDLINLD